MRDEEIIPSGLSPSEIFEHEMFAREFISNIDDILAEGKIGGDLATRLKPEMERIREFFLSMLGDSGDQELKSELEIIEIRYKVGEISQAKMEALKKDLLSKYKR